MLSTNLDQSHPSVRDLYWVVNSSSPYTLADITTWYDDSEWFTSFIAQLHANPLPLLDFLDDNRYILGHYFERLWQFYLTHNPRYTVLATNQQVIIDNLTLGEIDIIAYDSMRQQTIQIELSCKFYLNTDHSNNMQHMAHWIGICKADRLIDKHHNLTQKQTQLYKQPKVAQLLASQNIQIQDTIAILKGRSFANTQNCSNSQSNIWLTTAQLNLLTSNCQYMVLSKPQWLADTVCNPAKLLNVAQLTDFVQGSSPIGDRAYPKSRVPVQVACFTAAATVSSRRVFIVPAGWDVGN